MDGSDSAGNRGRGIIVLSWGRGHHVDQYLCFRGLVYCTQCVLPVFIKQFKTTGRFYTGRALFRGCRRKKIGPGIFNDTGGKGPFYFKLPAVKKFKKQRGMFKFLIRRFIKYFCNLDKPITPGLV